MRHADSGGRCLVAHLDHGQCMRCSVCGQWISPSGADGGCPGSLGREEPKSFATGTTKNTLIGEWTVESPEIIVLYGDYAEKRGKP